MSVDVQTRVAAGVAFLDERVPGWLDKVNVDDLQIWSGTQCVLGQIYGEYTLGVAWLRLDTKGAAELGFQAWSHETDFVSFMLDTAQQYAALNREWRRVLGILKTERVPVESKEATLVLV